VDADDVPEKVHERVVEALKRVLKERDDDGTQ
jgi:hypothetical protein